jgi:hypothetical protein
MNLMTQPQFGHDDEYMIFSTWCCDSVKHISHAYMVDVFKIYVDLHINWFCILVGVDLQCNRYMISYVWNLSNTSLDL